MSKIKKYITIAMVAVASCQPALAEQPKFSDQVLSVAYGFGFCNQWTPGYVWRDNKNRIIELIGIKHEKLIEKYYNKGVVDYNKKGFDYNDRKTCNLTINMLVKKLNETTRNIE